MHANLELINELIGVLGNTLRSRHILESGLEMPETLIQQCLTDIHTILTEINSRVSEVYTCDIVKRGAMITDLKMFIDLIDSTYTYSPSTAIEYFRAYLHYLFRQVSVCLCGSSFGEFHDPLVQAMYEAFPSMPELDEYDRKYNCKVIKNFFRHSSEEDLFFCGDLETIASAEI